MTTIEPGPTRSAAAHVLALMVAANGRADPRELDTLEALAAYGRLGVSKDQFLALVHESLQAVGAGLAECSWLRLRDQTHVDHLLERVTDRAERLLVCRLAAAVVTADGQVSGDERLVFDHMLARWHVSRSMLTEAILQDPAPPRAGAPQPLAMS